jgi:hypothetical protein
VRIPSYAIIDSENNEYRIQYYNRAHQPIEELAATFER